MSSYREFKLERSKDDWIRLIELLLEWEAYLNEPRMEVYHLRRLQNKHWYLLPHVFDEEDCRAMGGNGSEIVEVPSDFAP